MNSLEKFHAAHPVAGTRDLLARWTCLEKFRHFRPRAADWRDEYSGPLVLMPSRDRVHSEFDALEAFRLINHEATRTGGIMLRRPQLEWPTYQHDLW